MNKKELKDLLDQLGIHPSRQLGQNFLLDRNLLEAIIRDFDPQPGEPVLEIGAGAGGVTEYLVEAGCQVTAVEIDHRLCPWLREKFAECDNLRIIEGDACKVDYQALFTDRPYRCLANLPYAITSPWLMRMVREKNPPRSMNLLVQKELGERITAQPRSKQYGGLTVAVRLFYQTKLVRKVPANVFFPNPSVESACVHLYHSPLQEDINERCREYFFSLVRLAFSQRRKQLIKLLAPQFSRTVQSLPEILRNLGFASTVRAEELAPKDFLALARILEEEEGG